MNVRQTDEYVDRWRDWKERWTSRWKDGKTEDGKMDRYTYERIDT